MNEMKRILKKDGLLIVAQFVYLPKRSEVANQSENLVLKYNPKWTMAGSDGTFSSFGTVINLSSNAPSRSTSCRRKI